MFSLISCFRDTANFDYIVQFWLERVCEMYSTANLVLFLPVMRKAFQESHVAITN